MDSAACPNPKCSEQINIGKDSRIVQCRKCQVTIPNSHIETFKDVMTTTRMHVDRMKQSSMTCKPIS